MSRRITVPSWLKQLIVAALIASFPLANFVEILFQNGTHARFCPAASAWWLFRCLPTFEATAFLLLAWSVLTLFVWLFVVRMVLAFIR